MIRTRAGGNALGWSMALGAILLASGCATRTVAPVTVAAAPPPMMAPRPTLPAGMPERLNVPIQDEQGQYRTINYALSSEQVAWHVRSALNVAVLSCRGPGEAIIAADYNALLRRQKAGLATAYAGVQAQYRKTGGADWQTAQDANSTRVYNFFALPPAKPGFCAAATQILQESRTVEPALFGLFAASALPRLEQPFLDVYRAYDGYRRELAAWDARQAGGTALAQAAPVAAAPVVAMVTAPVVRSTPAASAKVAAAPPQLEYVGLDTLIDWQPRAPERMAAIR